MRVIRYTLSVVWKEIQLILKDRGQLAILFMLPLLLGVMMGSANVAGQGGGEEATILLHVALVNEDTGAFGAEVARAVQSIKELDVQVYDTVTEAEERVADGKVAAAIIVPAGFSGDIDSYAPTAVDVVIDPGQPESASIVTGIMNQVVAEVNIWGEVQYGVRNVMQESGLLAGATVEQRRAAEAQTLGVIMTTLGDLRRTPAVAVISENLEGEQDEGWLGAFFAMLFPGFTVMFIFLNVGFSASSLLVERESGALRRLLAAPIPRGAIIAGKMMAFMLLGCAQALILFFVARTFFDMPLGVAPGTLVVLTLVVALASAAMGMAVAGISKSSKQAGNIGVVLGLILAVIGGCIPMAGQSVSRSGGFMGTLANLTPHAHALEGYYRVMAENASFGGILPQLGILLAFCVAFFLVARWRFRFQ